MIYHNDDFIDVGPHGINVITFIEGVGDIFWINIEIIFEINIKNRMVLLINL